MSSLYLSTQLGSSSVTTAADTTATSVVASAQSNAAAATAKRIADLSVDLNALVAQGTALTTRSTTFATLAQNLQTFTSTLQTLRDSSQAAGIVATSSDAAVSVITGAHAGPSTATLSVTQLAHAQQNLSVAVSSATGAANLGTGTLTVQVGSQRAQSVQLAGSMSLTDIATTINAAKLGVTAQVVADGSNYRLEVTGSTTGAASDVTFTESGVGLELAATQTQQATDLVGTFDGASFTRDSNVVSDLLAGATLSVNATVTGATLQLAADADATVASVQNFVTAYNTLMTGLNTAQQSLEGANALTTLRGQLVNLVGNLASSTTGTYAGLAQVGVGKNSDDTLRIDASKLAQAAALDPYSVGALLSGTNGGTDGLAYDLQQVSKAYGAPAVGIFVQNQYGLATASNINARAVQNQQAFVEMYTAVYNANNTYQQVVLSDLAAAALIVQTLPYG